MHCLAREYLHFNTRGRLIFSSAYIALVTRLNAREWYWNDKQVISIPPTNIGTSTRMKTQFRIDRQDSIGIENTVRGTYHISLMSISTHRRQASPEARDMRSQDSLDSASKLGTDIGVDLKVEL